MFTSMSFIWLLTQITQGHSSATGNHAPYLEPFRFCYTCSRTSGKSPDGLWWPQPESRRLSELALSPFASGAMTYGPLPPGLMFKAQVS